MLAVGYRKKVVRILIVWRGRAWLRNISHFPYAVCFILLDEDECLKTPPVCDVNANCKNTLGSYLCSCKEGFMGDGNTCQGKTIRKTWIERKRYWQVWLFRATIWDGLLSLQEKWYHHFVCFVLCCLVFNKLAIIETSGTAHFIK